MATLLVDAAPDRRPRRLLDIGTGTGLVIEALRADVDDVIGIDVDADLLAVAGSGVEPGPGQHLGRQRRLEERGQDDPGRVPG